MQSSCKANGRTSPITKIIADPGSCHLGKLDTAKEIIKTAKQCGAWAVKFQLFLSSPPNIPISPQNFLSCVEYGKKISIPVFASVFDKSLCSYCTDFAKVAYVNSEHRVDLVKTLTSNKKLKKIFVSCDHINYLFSCDPRIIRLYCIPEYPVRYKIYSSFIKQVFRHKYLQFDGWSDHTIGIDQSKYIMSISGCEYIEKHFRLEDRDMVKVPDGRFAIGPDELKELCAKSKPIGMECYV